MTDSIYLSGWRYRAAVLSVAVSAVGYLVFSLWGGWHAVVDAVAKVGVGGVFIALMMSCVNYGLRFGRWQCYLNAFGHRVSWRPSLRIYLAGFALTTTPGKAGEVLRSALLKPWGVPYSQSFAAFLSERLSDLLAIVLMTLFGLSVYPQAYPMIVIGALLAVAGCIVFANPQMLSWADRLVRARTGAVFGLVKHLLNVLIEAQRCHQPGLLVLVSLLSSCAWGAEALAFHWILQWMGSDLTLYFAVFVYALSMLAGALSFMPGGLGGAEAVMVSLLVWEGMGSAEAVAATVLIRLATLWFAVALGGLALLKSKNQR